MEDHADKLDEEGKDFLGRISVAGLRTTQMINDLLELSRVMRAEMRREEVDLSSLAEDIAEGLKLGNLKRQVEFVIMRNLVVQGDRRLLRLVLENLLDNAWKFTAKQPRARIEFGVAERDGVPVYFVRDDGVGFDMAYAVKLFRVFERLHRVDEFEGTGIGLAMVARIVRRHGGRCGAKARWGMVPRSASHCE